MAALPRSRKLLCSGREEASRLKEAQVRHRFVVTTLVSPTPGETKKWGSLSLFRFRKRWASPPSRNTQVPDNPLYPRHSEGAFRPEESALDRKSTRLNSSHDQISYAVFCLK